MNDRFHLGSDTKAITALLGAMLVEHGKLRWSSTFGEVFPELADKAVPGLRGATLSQFLSHTSGLPSDNDDSPVRVAWPNVGRARRMPAQRPARARRWAAGRVLPRRSPWTLVHYHA